MPSGNAIITEIRVPKPHLNGLPHLPQYLGEISDRLDKVLALCKRPCIGECIVLVVFSYLEIGEPGEVISIEILETADFSALGNLNREGFAAKSQAPSST